MSYDPTKVTDHHGEALAILAECCSKPGDCEELWEPAIHALVHAVLYVGDQLAAQRPEAPAAHKATPRLPTQEREPTG